MRDALDQEHIQQLITMMESGTWRAMQQARDEVAQIGTAAIPLLLDSLQACMQNSYKGYSAQIIELLGVFREPAAVDLLLPALAKENPHLRQAAARALGEIGDPRAIDALIASFLTESGDTEDITAWMDATTALAKIGKSAIVPLSIALSHADAVVRANSAEALGKIADPEPVPLLIAMLHDPDVQVRYEAAQALGIIADHRSLDDLFVTLHHDLDEHVRYRAVIALGNFPTDKVLDSLLQALDDPTVVVRTGAIHAMTACAGAKIMYLLIGLLYDPEPCIRSSAAYCLSKVGDGRALPALERLENDNASCGANPVRNSITYAIDHILSR